MLDIVLLVVFIVGLLVYAVVWSYVWFKSDPVISLRPRSAGRFRAAAMQRMIEDEIQAQTPQENKA